MKTIVILGVAHALFLIALLFPKARHSKNHRLLILWLSLMILNQLYFLNTIIQFEVPKSLLILGASVVLLASPVYYFYVRSLTMERKAPWIIEIIHYLPFLLFNAFFLHLYFTDPEFVDFQHGFIYSKQYEAVAYYGYILAIIPLIYYLRSAQLIRTFRFRLNENYSTIDQINLSWLVVWIFAALILFAASFLVIYLSTAHTLFSQKLAFQWVGVFNTLYIFYLGYFGLKKTHLYSGLTFPDTVENLQEPNNVENEGDRKPKYQKSSLTSDQAELHKNQLLLYLHDHKPYLNANLTLTQLADDMKISPNILSQVINQWLGSTFFKIINKYRVEEVKKCMTNKKYDHYTLLGIALECGFNGKSTFIKAFKEFTGVTPTAYKNSLQEKLDEVESPIL